MKPQTLKAFFEGRVTADALASEGERQNGRRQLDGTCVLCDDLKEDFAVESDHLVALCDAVLNGHFPACLLEHIASVLVQSEHFVWDPRSPSGKRVSEVIYAWEAPEINYLLTRETVLKFRNLLLTGEKSFVQDDWWR